MGSSEVLPGCIDQLAGGIEDYRYLSFRRLNAAILEQVNPVGVFIDQGVVGRQENRNPFLFYNHLKQRENLAAGGGVQFPGRFIRQD
jgi:hypothetical protein